MFKPMSKTHDLYAKLKQENFVYRKIALHLQYSTCLKKLIGLSKIKK